jgi:hypothetical protein
MLARTDKGGIFGNASAMKADVIREANEFAASQGKVAVPVALKEDPMYIGHFASVEYQFRVVDKSDPEAMPKEQRNLILKEKVERASAECRQKRLNGELKSYVESVQCSNPLILQAYQEAGDPNMDLIQLLCAYREAVAERNDKGELTEAEGHVAIQELTLRVNQEARQRAAQQRAESRQQAMDVQQENNARMQAYGTLLQGLGTWQSANKVEMPKISGPAYVSPQISIACQRVGNFTYCH